MTMEWIEGERLRTASSSNTTTKGAGKLKGSEDDLALVEVWGDARDGGIKMPFPRAMNYDLFHLRLAD